MSGGIRWQIIDLARSTFGLEAVVKLTVQTISTIYSRNLGVISPLPGEHFAARQRVRCRALKAAGCAVSTSCEHRAASRQCERAFDKGSTRRVCFYHVRHRFYVSSANRSNLNAFTRQ